MRTQLLLCLSITSAFAQQNAARFPPAEWNHPITLDVAVTEKSGKAITGLQQQDFTLLDKKQQQKILSFQAVTGPAAADPPVKAILLIDEVNTGFDHVAYTRQQVTKFLKQSGGQLAVPVSLALFSDAGVKMFGAPTRDAAALQAQLDDNQNGLRTIRRSQGIYGADERLDLSIRAIAQLAEQLGQEPGRKLILWVGPGWPYLSGPNIDLDSKTQARFFNSIVDFSAVLRHNRITLYSIDPLGTDDGVLRPTFYEEYLKGVTSSRQVQIADMSQQVLAAQSGGLVLHSNNDIAGQIARCIADANTYYILTFDGIPGDGPNEYHPLEVKIDKPGTIARTRTGYYAQPEPAAVPK